MKTKLISILIIMMAVFATSASADRFVNWEFREATIQTDGSMVYSNTPVTDVSNIGVVCADNICSTVSGNLRSGAVTSSGTTDSMTLTYPTADVNVETYGYGEYFYKPGYILWEQNPSFWGTDAADPAGPYTVYLSRKTTCNAPINTFSVLNDVQPNIPLVIDISSSLDATTYAALSGSGPLSYIPSSIADQYMVDTKVTLTIYDENINVVDQQVENIQIPASGAENVQFTWTPTISGDYRAVVETDVTDSKCISSATQSSEKEFTVLEEDPTNICYTLLNGLATNDQFPTEGETLDIFGVKTSNHADNVGALSSIPTDLTMTVTKQSNNQLVLTQSTTLAANIDAVAPAPFDFSWTIPSVGEGWYTIEVTGTANDAVCSGLENTQETVSVDVYVRSLVVDPNNGAPTLAGIPDVATDENVMPADNLVDLWQYASDSETSDSGLQYIIVSQSNPSLITCTLDSNQYIDCGMPTLNQYGFSDITIEVSDGFYSDRDTFRVYVLRTQDYPVITNIPNVEFEVGSYAELDLDDYVSDANYADSALTWAYTGDTDIQVSIDQVSHIVRFESPISEATEAITFTVTNPDGLTDSDISVAVAYIDRVITIGNRLQVRARIHGDDHLTPGEMLRLGVSVENIHDDDVENVQITTIVHELDMRDNVGPFTLDPNEVASKRLYMEVPQDAGTGMYSLRLTISNDNIRRVIYREFVIE